VKKNEFLQIFSSMWIVGVKLLGPKVFAHIDIQLLDAKRAQTGLISNLSVESQIL
jgi:hypothetical protein